MRFGGWDGDKDWKCGWRQRLEVRFGGGCRR